MYLVCGGGGWLLVILPSICIVLYMAYAVVRLASTSSDCLRPR
jgi:hypothetical protein